MTQTTLQLMDTKKSQPIPMEDIRLGDTVIAYSPHLMRYPFKGEIAFIYERSVGVRMLEIEAIEDGRQETDYDVAKELNFIININKKYIYDENNIVFDDMAITLKKLRDREKDLHVKHENLTAAISHTKHDWENCASDKMKWTHEKESLMRENQRLSTRLKTEADLPNDDKIRMKHRSTWIKSRLERVDKNIKHTEQRIEDYHSKYQKLLGEKFPLEKDMQYVSNRINALYTDNKVKAHA